VVGHPFAVDRLVGVPAIDVSPSPLAEALAVAGGVLNVSLLSLAGAVHDAGQLPGRAGFAGVKQLDGSPGSLQAQGRRPSRGGVVAPADSEHRPDRQNGGNRLTT
jgi:hypothetical protein